MTRKQAVLQAIRLLEKNKKNNQIVEVLKGLYDDLPITIWTKENILDSFTDFILENNRLPVKSDLLRGKLPSSKTINNIFSTRGLLDFEKKYFPEYYNNSDRKSCYWWYTDEDFKNVFIENYNAINNGRYVKYDDYDLYKNPGTPTVHFLVEKFGCKSYNELIEIMGLKKQRHKMTAMSNKKYISIQKS